MNDRDEKSRLCGRPATPFCEVAPKPAEGHCGGAVTKPRLLGLVRPLGCAMAVALGAACGSGNESADHAASAGNGSSGGGGSGGAAGAAGAGGAPSAGGAGGTAVPERSCNTASGSLPDGATELAWDDGKASGDIRRQESTITVNDVVYALDEIPLHEAIRFDIEHPAKIYGFKVHWSNLPADVDTELALEAGLYSDFGYNGFDFWEKDPLWTGTRCAGDIDAEGWIDYVLDSPIEVADPGLVFVAHKTETAEDPAFAYDESAAEDCDAFDNCHSAFNAPEVPGYYNGVSLRFQRDFLVRLLVEYTDDVTAEEKIFQKVTTATGQHVSWGDYDNDGWDDLLVNGQLYRNDQGEFVDATDSSGIGALEIDATSGVWGDYDNDGCLDLFLFSESPGSGNALLRSNCDGTFDDATEQSKLVDTQSYEDCGDPANIYAPSAAASWLDLDADGFLDLYVANYSCGSKGTHYSDTFFRNQADGSFEDWSGKRGFWSTKTPSRGAAPADADGDGDVDLFINNYRLIANAFYENNGDGTVSNVAEDNGLAGVRTPSFLTAYYGHTIGAAWGDLDNDGDFDLLAANLAHPRFFDFSDKTQILLNDGKGVFTDNAGTWERPSSPAGLRYQETHSVPVLADFDQDGALDLVITAIYEGRPTDFYWGQGDGTFQLDAYHAGLTTENGWGAASADFDNDGDPDVFATSLFRNTLSAAASGHFLQVRVIGNVASNWAGVGATVRVVAGEKRWMRQVQGGTGKGGQDSLTLHFGLGETTQVDEITITFPGGKRVEFSGPISVDQRLWLGEDGGQHQGFSPPP